jgi:YVTN family beta-propeller protein
VPERPHSGPRLPFRWLIALLAIGAVGLAVARPFGDGSNDTAGPKAWEGTPRVGLPTTAANTPAPTDASAAKSPALSLSASPTPALGPPSTQLRLELVDTITGNLSPKSVVSSQTGLFFVQNMMYRHTVVVYDRERELVKTISDEVDLSELGHRRLKGTYRGAPVEAAFSPDGRYAYVSNYAMYGPGFTNPGDDVCSPASGYDESFLYRIDTETLQIDQAIAVGSVPKYVATTPDGRYVLVTNWCSYSMSVVDTATAEEIRRVQLGPYPRGIIVSPDSRTAYVAVMGTTGIAEVDLRSFRVRWMYGIGDGPRHVVLDPTGRWLYVTLNRTGGVAKIDTRTRRKVDVVSTGSYPRSMAISRDGRALYVVNYESDTMSKVGTRNMRVLQTVPTDHHPIGITYDDATRQVWVSCYGGSLMVFQDE